MFEPWAANLSRMLWASTTHQHICVCAQRLQAQVCKQCFWRTGVCICRHHAHLMWFTSDRVHSPMFLLLLLCSLLSTCAGIVRLLRDLDKQARQQGGAVYMLNGNHESLNVCGDFRCGSIVETAVLPAQMRQLGQSVQQLAIEKPSSMQH